MENVKKLDKAGDVLKNLPFFNNISSKEAENYTGMFQSWEMIVGKKLAGYSRIKDLDKHSLIVEADHPAIIQLLQINYSQTLRRLNNKYPELKISDLRILLKNPGVVYEHKKESSTLAGDMEESDSMNRKTFDISRIDNENFKDLLMKMKKRS
jgi:hypothetical protein